jgi:hypothetical protein
VSLQLGFIEFYANQRMAELQREAERDRLADLATRRPRRPWRARLADRLYAIADRIDGRPRTIIRAQA